MSLGWAEGHRTCALLVTDGVLVLHVVLVLLAAQVQLVQVKRVAEECIIWASLFPPTTFWEIVQSLLLKFLACFAKMKSSWK